MPSMFLLFSALLAIILDQISKRMIASCLQERGSLAVGPVRLQRLVNRRSGTASSSNTRLLVTLWGVELVALNVIASCGPASDRTALAAAIGAAFGGATSNLIDRMRHNGVVDFIDFEIWPVFNLADATICVGAVAALLIMFA